MPKRKVRKVYSDPILQDCNITSASNINTDVSYPSDTTFEENMEKYEVLNHDLNQTTSFSQMHKLDGNCEVTESSEVQFKIPFSNKNVRNCRPSLFDSIFDDPEPITPESSASAEPFKRKCPGKDISFSISSSNCSIDDNLSARREPKFVKKQKTRSKTCAGDNSFDSDFDASIIKHKLPSCDANNSYQIQTRKSTIANYKGKKLSVNNSEDNSFDSDFEESIIKHTLPSCDANNSFQIQTRKSTIASYKGKKLSVNNSGIFNSDLESSYMTGNISNLDNIIESIEEENDNSHKNITTRNKNEKLSYLPKFLTKSKTTIGQNFSNNTFDSIIFNESSSVLSSEPNSGFQSPLSGKELPLTEQIISADNVTNNLSSSKSPQLPLVKTKNGPDEVNEDSSDFESSGILLHYTTHTTDNIINDNSSNTNRENESNNVENSKDIQIGISNMSEDIAPKALVADDRPRSPAINQGTNESIMSISSKSGSTSSRLINEKETDTVNTDKQMRKQINSVESSRTFRFQDVNTSQEDATNNPIVEENVICSNVFPTQEIDKLSSDNSLPLDENQETARPNNNSLVSGTSLDQSISKVSKSTDKVNTINDRSEHGNMIIREETIRVSDCLNICPLADNSISPDIAQSRKSAAKRSLCKRVSFRISDINLCPTPASVTANDCSVKVGHNSSTSLGPLVYDDSSEVLNRDSVYIDIHASRSRNSGSVNNSNSENQLVNPNNSDNRVEDEDASENIQITEPSNLDERESDHEGEEYTEGSADTNEVDDDTEDQNKENIASSNGDNDSSKQNMAYDDTEHNRENYPEDGDDEDISYSNSNSLTNTIDESSCHHSDGSVRGQFEGGNQQSEKYAAGTPSYNDKGDKYDKRPIKNVSTRRNLKGKIQERSNILSPSNKNVYEEYESFLRNKHDNENQFLHTAQAGHRHRTNTILFKKPLPKKSSKSQTKNILDNVPYSELKTKKRRASKANREQTMHNEIEESLRTRKKQEPIFNKLNSGKLKKPKKWVSSSLYEFIINKLKPKYGVNSRVQAEKLVLYLVGQVDKVLKIQDLSFYSNVEEIKLKLANLRVIRTHFDFREFVMKHFDALFSFKVYPFGGDVSNPFEPENIFEVIPVED